MACLIRKTRPPWNLVILFFILGTGTDTQARVRPETPDSGRDVQVTAATASPTPQARQQPSPFPEKEETSQLSRKQKKDLLKYNFEKMKRDADDLAALAKSLQKDLEKSSENVLSLQVVEKAEKIEKLAKRIKGAARGY